ncbi:hypothetical protein FS837_011900 [Tulasnella sp. UAMH 9824]|nr:hypothetical protein FS837_011900 [Tulasnella sp. UAMH 9824]
MPIQSRTENENLDAINEFLRHCQKVTTDARLLKDSLPNVDIPAAKRSVTLLQAITTALDSLDDPWLEPEDIRSAQQEVLENLLPLEQFLSSGPVGQSTARRRFLYSGNAGRPPLDIDLEAALELHRVGNSWDSVARALGTVQSVLMDHLKKAGHLSERPAFTDITDDELDEVVAEIIMEHPFIGGAIVHGHLESREIRVPRRQVTECLQRIDSVGVLVRFRSWAGIIKRRIYKVRGANALWHHDGNEKLRPWGFYVHGCVDGFSCLVIYLVCCNNKRAATVEGMFLEGVNIFGWPSRVRGDYGKENNGVERRMHEHWGRAHNAYLRGRSIQNIRIERLWRDVRKDSLEAFRRVFLSLEEEELLDMSDTVQRAALFLVFQPRIQSSLDQTQAAWNNHKIRTAGNKTPLAMFELSRATAITEGYWTGDPGDLLVDAEDPLYGCDGEAGPLPQNTRDHTNVDEDPVDIDEDLVNDSELSGLDEELEWLKGILEGFDFEEDNGNWGIDVYLNAVALAYERIEAASTVASVDIQ